jgi:hypothetical protein
MIFMLQAEALDFCRVLLIITGSLLLPPGIMRSRVGLSYV